MLGRWLPPHRQPVRATREYQFARQLARSHLLTLAFVSDSSDVAGTVSALRSEFGDLEFSTVPRSWKALSSAVRLAAGESCTLSYFRSEALRTRLADRMRRTRYDLVFVLSSGMIQYALSVDASVPMAVDFGSVDSAWWARQADRASFGAGRFFRTEAARLRAAEVAAARRAGRCSVESPEAADIVRGLAPGVLTTVIPTGVDVDAFEPVVPAGKVPTVVLNVAADADGDLEEAMKFCQALRPAVRARIPDVRFVVASRRPFPIGVDSRGDRGVEVVASGTDLRLLLHDQAVAIAPLHDGSDLRSSVLEPMAAGVPVVAHSRIGQYLAVQAGSDVLTCDSAGGFAAQVVGLLQNDALREEVGVQGRRFVHGNCSWSAVGASLERMLADILGRRPGPEADQDRPIRALHGG